MAEAAGDRGRGGGGATQFAFSIDRGGTFTGEAALMPNCSWLRVQCATHRPTNVPLQ